MCPCVEISAHIIIDEPVHIIHIEIVDKIVNEVLDEGSVHRGREPRIGSSGSGATKLAHSCGAPALPKAGAADG